tara:strand:+ start:875 stop:2230 length:1356 start_codon:yes stop_codon:yes gene_type:complete
MIPSINNIKLLKIIKPIWYYYIEGGDSTFHWVDYRNLSNKKKMHIDYCDLYDDENASLLDAMYQAWHRGFIKTRVGLKMEKNYHLSFFDQYLFIRRMFKPVWVYYLILIRLITFKFRLSEISAFVKTMGTKMVDLNNPHINYETYSSFDDDVLRKTPLISIVLPTLNRYPQLNEVLIDLEMQNYKNFEVIVIDQSDLVNTKFYDKYDLNLKHVIQKEKALWRARNEGIKLSNAEYILFLDDDSKVSPNWIFEHLKCLHYFDVEISAGVSISVVGAPTPKHYSYFRLGDQLDTGNVLIRKKVFEKVGLFDLQFEGMRMGDHEFGARAHKNGFSIVNNFRAKRYHFKTPTGGLREISGWDGFRPNSLFKPRPVPSVLYLYRKYWGDGAAVFSLILLTPISLMPYKLKGLKIAYIISLLVFISLFPFIFLQLFRAWKRSSRMLRIGPKINFINP